VKKQNNKDKNKMQVKIKKLSSDAIIPTYAKASDAGLDLVATSIVSATPTQITYGLGISLEIPNGFMGLVFPRSSIRNYDLALTNSVGVIDSGYRGELQATFHKTKGLESKIYEVGERVVQIIIIPHPSIEFQEVEELTNTERGEGGFGSTGK
jgi:dUTP pyrophosphatase